MKRTKNPIIWLRYLAWKVQFWWSFKNPLDRIFINYNAENWKLPKAWTAERYNYRLKWLNRIKKIGWRLLFSHIRTFAKYSHKCEFTDKKCGLLYGGEGAHMDELFDEFIRRIS